MLKWLVIRAMFTFNVFIKIQCKYIDSPGVENEYVARKRTNKRTHARAQETDIEIEIVRERERDRHREKWPR